MRRQSLCRSWIIFVVRPKSSSRCSMTCEGGSRSYLLMLQHPSSTGKVLCVSRSWPVHVHIHIQCHLVQPINVGCHNACFSSVTYRNVMSDITRLLYLLNKRASAVEMPPDGIQLLIWSEQILHRYLASHVWPIMCSETGNRGKGMDIYCMLHGDQNLTIFSRLENVLRYIVTSTMSCLECKLACKL